MADPVRTIRKPPEQAAFDAIVLSASKFDIGRIAWKRLARVAYPNQFFPSSGSRLTPISRAFPCVYLGENDETAVAEVWGDRFYAQRELGLRVYAIFASEASEWQFLRVKTFPPLTLCDLTAPATLLATGLDAGTLYHTDLAIPQGWAEAIARHPAGFDGIIYRSRHTNEVCIVAWTRPARALDKEFEFEPTGPFLNSVPAHAVATKMKLGLSFVT